MSAAQTESAVDVVAALFGCEGHDSGESTGALLVAPDGLRIAVQTSEKIFSYLASSATRVVFDIGSADDSVVERIASADVFIFAEWTQRAVRGSQPSDEADWPFYALFSALHGHYLMQKPRVSLSNLRRVALGPLSRESVVASVRDRWSRINGRFAFP